MSPGQATFLILDDSEHSLLSCIRRTYALKRCYGLFRIHILGYLINATVDLIWVINISAYENQMIVTDLLWKL